jgi:hypothetical protein
MTALTKSGARKSERDRHVDFADAAFFSRDDLLDTGDGPGKDFLEPSPATRRRSAASPARSGLGVAGRAHDEPVPP